jgi:hypothetical protein
MGDPTVALRGVTGMSESMQASCRALPLTLMMLCACGARESHTPVILENAADAGADPFVVTLEFSPSHVHRGDVVTFNFRVEETGTPVSSLSPQLAVKQISGGSAEAMVAVPESTTGTYVCKHVFWEEGSYSLTLSFEKQGVSYARGFGITTHPHP